MKSLGRPFALLARRGLETKLGSLGRLAILSREARHEQAFVLERAEQVQAQTFCPVTFEASMQPKPDADTFFILGSGPSINEISPANFDEIADQRSVGINNWGIHPFIPDMYSFENVPQVGDGQGLHRALRFLWRDDIRSARPKLLVLRINDAEDANQLDILPPELRSNLTLYGRVTPSTRDASNLREDLVAILKLLRHRFPGVVVDSGASVIRMLSVGLALNFKRLVLAGVDLNNTRYFWEEGSNYEDPLIPDLPPNTQHGDAHETTSTMNRPFSVQEMIEKLSSVISTEYGGQLFVSSNQSDLASFLPVYPWR